MSNNLSTAKAQQMATSAKEKIQGMWTSLRSMTIDEDNEGSFRLPRSASLENVAGWETMVKTMFGSCTNGIPTTVTEELSPSNSSRTTKSRSCDPSEPASPSREKEEFFYAQFLSNDRMRAQQAVSVLRETVDKIAVASERPKSSLSKPFPVSSPIRKEMQVPPILVQEIVPRRSDLQGDISGAVSFDDGISAISAHTLEELARHHEEPHAFGHVQSDLTSEGFETVQSKESTLFSPSFSPTHRSHGSPVDASRTRSGLSKKSAGTRSTKSSSEFENVWRRDEQRYWQDMVDKEQTMGRPTTPQERQQIMLQRVEALKQRSRSRESVSLFSLVVLPSVLADRSIWNTQQFT